MSDQPNPMETKRAPCSFAMKAIDEDARTFEGLASTWDLDLGGDVIHHGAFKKSLTEWKKSGKVLPLLDSHNYFSVLSAVGKMDEAKETKQGLWTKWSVIDGPDGDRVLDRMRSGVIDSMSIGYQAKQFDFKDDEDVPGGLIRHLHEVALKEVSLVLFPMQPNALIDLGSVKSRLETDRAALQHLHDELGRLLSAPPAVAPSPPPAKAAEDEDDPFNLLAELMVQRLTTARS